LLPLPRFCVGGVGSVGGHLALAGSCWVRRSGALPQGPGKVDHRRDRAQNYIRFARDARSACAMKGSFIHLRWMKVPLHGGHRSVRALPRKLVRGVLRPGLAGAADFAGALGCCPRPRQSDQGACAVRGLMARLFRWAAHDQARLVTGTHRNRTKGWLGFAFAGLACGFAWVWLASQRGVDFPVVREWSRRA
jgi:hypothetical protein